MTMTMAAMIRAARSTTAAEMRAIGFQDNDGNDANDDDGGSHENHDHDPNQEKRNHEKKTVQTNKGRAGKKQIHKLQQSELSATSERAGDQPKR